MKQIAIILCSGIFLSLPHFSQAQILKKLKEKANSAVNKVVEKKTGVESSDNTIPPNQQLRVPIGANRQTKGEPDSKTPRHRM
jgi:hypothetical protein